MRKIFLLIPCLGLLGFGFIKPTLKQTTWVVGFDRSGSIPPHEAAIYSKIIRTAALELLKPGDMVVILRPAQPELAPATFHLDTRLSRFEQKVREIERWLYALRPPQGQHGTDLGLVLAHVCRQLELDRRTGVEAQYRIVVVSDGVAEGKQSIISPAPLAEGDYKLLFIGVRQGMEAPLRKLAARAGFRDDQILVVPFAHWEELAPALSQFLERSQNPRLTKRLSWGEDQEAGR